MTERWHSPGCTCGICRTPEEPRPAPRLPQRVQLSRRAYLVAAQALLTVLLFVGGVAYGCHHYRPANLHCVHDRGTEACWTVQHGLSTAPSLTPFWPADYSTPCIALASFRDDTGSGGC